MSVVHIKTYRKGLTKDVAHPLGKMVPVSFASDSQAIPSLLARFICTPLAMHALIPVTTSWTVTLVTWPTDQENVSSKLKAQSFASDGCARYSLRASATPKRVCYRIVDEEFEKRHLHMLLGE